jgi:hypothetical protein
VLDVTRADRLSRPTRNLPPALLPRYRLQATMSDIRWKQRLQNFDRAFVLGQ